jgi:hypothetical protein
MPHNHTVHLKVRNQPSNGNDGYTDTTATNNAIYSYRYTGGDNDHGNISETVGLGSATIEVGLDGGSNYQISNVTFGNDTQNQLSWRPGSTADNAVVIDANTQVENASYCTTVTDTTANCAFNCDPMVSNERNPPKAM